MTLSTTYTITGMKKQQGIVLVVALLILVVMTVLGVSMLSSSTIEERMASNLQSQNVTFQAAESCIRTTFLPANKPLREAAILNPTPNQNNLPVVCDNLFGVGIASQVNLVTPTAPAPTTGTIQKYSLGKFTGYVLTMNATSSLGSGAASNVQVVGKQPAPALQQ